MMTREEWLERLRDKLAHEYGLTVALAVSVGFPSKSALARKSQRIGECWDGSIAANGLPQIFVSPLLGQADAAHVLLHEMVHATVGCKAGHKGEFARLAKQCGLVKPWTATKPSEACARRLNELCAEIGEYPHSVLRPAVKEKPGSRLLLLTCPCGIKVRMARATYDACGGMFHGDDDARCELTLKA